MDEINIDYYRPNIRRRIFCALFDLLVASLFFLALFIGFRSAVYSMPSYLSMQEELTQLKLDSNLYIESEEEGRVEDIVTYYNLRDDVSPLNEANDLEARIENFLYFLKANSGIDSYQKVKEDYDSYRLDASMIYQDEMLFIEDDDGSITKNSSASEVIPSSIYVEECYEPWIDERGLGYFVSENVRVININKSISYRLFFFEIPLSLLFSSLLVYYAIPLCFYRNKSTLGRFIFKIGLVDSKCLSVGFWRYSASFVIFFILEICLSIFTLAMPLLISSLMMFFTKKKQTFHEYMLGIEEIDVTSDKIYRNFDEIRKENIETKPIDFSSIERL
jgi:uncharacterized RDD family membrane protein YckC